MKTTIHNLQQGSSEWLKLRESFDTASEAPASQGKSKYTSRSDLLKQKSTGLCADVGAAKQALFDRGHASEESARSIAERLLDDDLYPITATSSIDGINLLASLDGATMDRKIIWEHKLYSEKLAADVRAGNLDPHYTIQMDQQLLVTGAQKCMFMTSDGTDENMAWCWYESSQEKFDALLSGWAQFHADLATYVPPEVATPVVAQSASNLPVVFDMRVEGRLVSCNIEQYKPAALAYIKDINTELITDQHFANADVDAKFCRSSADKLKLAIEQALGQMGDINTALNSVREIAAAFDAKGLLLEKLVKSEKEARKLAIVSEGAAELVSHVQSLSDRIGQQMPAINSDFPSVVKGLKSIDSMRDKVATELARCKIEANAIADKITANLKAIDEQEGFGFLFYDRKQLALKEHEFVAMAIKSRIADHTEKEAARIAAETARIAEQESVKAEAAAQARADAEIAAATAAAQAEAARASAEAIAKAAMINKEPIHAEPDLSAISNATSSVSSSSQSGNAAQGGCSQGDGGIRSTGTPGQAGVVVQEIGCSAGRTPSPLTPPTLRLGQICARLDPDGHGFTMTADFLKSLGFEPAGRERAAVLFHESDFDRICAALISHISAVRQGVAA